MPKPAFLFAPGAGAPSTHPWMQRWAKLLSRVGQVTLMDYEYALAGRRRPDPLPRLIAAHQEAVLRLRKKTRRPIVLIGKSMGGRIGCHVSLIEAAHAVVCLGYPLCGGGDPKKLRDKVLTEMDTPVLFIQGLRDPLCPLPLLAKVRKEMTAPNQLVVVTDADHSLQVARRWLKTSGETQDWLEEGLVHSIAQFVER